MKQLIRTLLVFLCLSLALTPAYAAEAELPPVREPGQCGEDVWWSLSDTGELTIRGTGAMDDFGTAPWTESREQILALSVEDGITYIGAHAFEDLDNLERVRLGNGITELGTAAFRSCDALTELSLPKGFKILGEECLRSCAMLRSIRFAGGMPKFKLNCLWDTTVELIYPAKNPWPLEHILQLEEAFQGRMEFLCDDGTDPNITEQDVLEAQQAALTEPTETTQPTQPETEATLPPTQPETETTEPTVAATVPETLPQTTAAPAPETAPETLPPVYITEPTQPEPPRRSEDGGPILALVLGLVSMVLLVVLIIGRLRGGKGKYGK